MIDTTLDTVTKPEKSRPRKGKDKKKISDNKYAEMVADVSRVAREKLLEGSEYLWDAKTPVSVGPVALILEKEDIGANEKLIIVHLLSTSPDFVHHKSSVQKLLSKTGKKKCSEKTAYTYLHKLYSKGYLGRHRVNWGSEGGYHRYYLQNLFLGGNGKNDIGTKLKLSLSLPAEQKENAPAVHEFEKRKSRAESDAFMIARYVAQPTGDIQETVPSPTNPRKFLGLRKKMKDGLLFEDGAAAAAERKRRITAPKASDPAEHTSKKVRPSKAKNWKSGECSGAKALAWIAEHPDGIAIGERLLDMTNQEEWTSQLARMAFRRWRNGELKLKQLFILQQVVGHNYEKINLRYLLTEFQAIIADNAGLLLSEKLVLGRKVQRYAEGDEALVYRQVTTAHSYIKSRERQGLVDRDWIFDKSTPEIRRYALLMALCERGYMDIALEYQDRRGIEIECEMVENLSVWNAMRQLYKEDPDRFFFDKLVLSGLKAREKTMLQQECIAHGTTMKEVLELVHER